MYDISGSAWDFKCTQTAPAPQMLYYDQSALLGGTRGAKHILKCPPSRHAPECRLYTWSIRIKLKLFWKEVGNGILLDHPLPIKLHQSYQPQSTFYSGIESRIARNLVGTPEVQLHHTVCLRTAHEAIKLELRSNTVHTKTVSATRTFSRIKGRSDKTCFCISLVLLLFHSVLCKRTSLTFVQSLTHDLTLCSS